MSIKFDRRNFMAASASSLLLWKANRGLSADSQAADPHFYLQIHLDLGADSLYLFDGKPLAMKESKILQNYTNKEPTPWEGTNGEVAYAYDTMDPLKEVKDYFSVVHGIHTLVDSVSHDQNVMLFMAANAFGGDWFAPNAMAGGEAPLAFVQMGTVIGPKFKNAGEGIILNKSTFGSNPFEGISGKRPAGTLEDPSASFIQSRYGALTGGSGLFSRGVSLLGKSFGSIGILERALAASAAPQTTSTDPMQPALTKFAADASSALSFFKGGVAQSALIVYEPKLPGGFDSTFDAHDTVKAGAQPATFRKFAEEFRDLINLLRSTPYDATRSFFDVTTVVVETDFSRTMVSDSSRNSSSLDVNTTGSDHNPLTNTVLMAGKGIKGGVIVGGTDATSVDDYANLSKAHLQKDPSRNRLMGSVYDFSTHKADYTSKPEVYKASDYINTANVVNTILKALGAPDSELRSIPGAGIGNKAKILDPLV